MLVLLNTLCYEFTLNLASIAENMPFQDVLLILKDIPASFLEKRGLHKIDHILGTLLILKDIPVSPVSFVSVTCQMASVVSPPQFPANTPFQFSIHHLPFSNFRFPATGPVYHLQSTVYLSSCLFNIAHFSIFIFLRENLGRWEKARKFERRKLFATSLTQLGEFRLLFGSKTGSRSIRIKSPALGGAAGRHC